MLYQNELRDFYRPISLWWYFPHWDNQQIPCSC